MKSQLSIAVIASLAAVTYAQSSTSSAAAAEITAVTDCHTHRDTPYCIADGEEWEVETEVDINSLPDEFTDCHAHGADELHCDSPQEVTLSAASDEEEEQHTASSSTPSATPSATPSTTPSSTESAAATSSAAVESQTEDNLASATERSLGMALIGAGLAALNIL